MNHFLEEAICLKKLEMSSVKGGSDEVVLCGCTCAGWNEDSTNENAVTTHNKENKPGTVIK